MHVQAQHPGPSAPGQVLACSASKAVYGPRRKRSATHPARVCHLQCRHVPSFISPCFQRQHSPLLCTAHPPCALPTYVAQEDAFVSGGIDGSMCLWLAGCKEPQAKLDMAHDSSILSIAFHPVGHIVATGGLGAPALWAGPGGGGGCGVGACAAGYMQACCTGCLPVTAHSAH